MFGFSPLKRAASATSGHRLLGIAWLICWSLLGGGLIWGSVTSYAHADRARLDSASLRGLDIDEQDALSESARPPMKNIEDIVPGDIVLAEDETTGELAPKRVVQVFRNFTDHLRIIRIRSSDGAVQELQTTDEHPFYVESLGWTAAKDLSAGQRLVESDGNTAAVIATECEAHPEGVPVFNFEVEDCHTYFVAESASSVAVLVHNACKGGTYKLVDKQGNVVRTGRSKDLARRELEHARDPALSNYKFRVDKRTDSYNAQRGREQIIHDRYKPPLDKIEPISPNNPKRGTYIGAGNRL